MRLPNALLGAALALGISATAQSQMQFSPTLLDRKPSVAELESRVVDSLAQKMFLPEESFRCKSFAYNSESRTMNLGMVFYFDKKLSQKIGNMDAVQDLAFKYIAWANKRIAEEKLHNNIVLHYNGLRFIDAGAFEFYIDADRVLDVMKKNLPRTNLYVYLTGYDIVLPERNDTLMNRSMVFSKSQGFRKELVGYSTNWSFYSVVEYQTFSIADFLNGNGLKLHDFDLNVNVFMHEVLHCIGASHDEKGFGPDNKENIMSRSGTGGVRMTPKTKKEIDLYIMRRFPNSKLN